MFDKELAIEILHQIYQATLSVLKRFEPINSSTDFTNSEFGMEKLDSICMQLIAIGESLKNLDKVTNNNLLKNYNEIDWKKVKGMRDIISHHYFDVDAEAIFDVCQNHIPELNKTINKIISELS
ncbi:MAG: antitoxin [Ignavibacteria bacterium GWB2_35_6b]|nr:MAG: antitoxin [Ignavibacteria bacterium GWB2_35_6b]